MLNNDRIKGLQRKFGKLSLDLNMIMLPIFLIVLLAVFSIQEPRFISSANITNILRQSSDLFILAVAVSFAILVGGIDVSIGSIVGAAGIATVVGAQHFGMIGIVLGPCIGVIVGLINGVIISQFRVPPFVITLGMMTALRGVIYLCTGGQPIFGGIPGSFKMIGAGVILGIPIPFIIALTIMLLSAVLLKYSYLGRYFYAVGSNENAAWLSGIHTKKVKTIAYALCGLLSGIAGVILSSRVNSGQPNLGTSMELDAIAAAVIGGVAMSGGKGNVLGVFFGVLVLAILRNGLNLVNVSSFVQMVVIGSIIIFAVIVDSKKNKK